MLPAIYFGRVFCPREIVLSISFLFYEFFPFGKESTLSNLTGQSISSEHRGIGCCWDRDCVGLNEVVRNFMGFHVCVRCMCAQWEWNQHGTGALTYQSELCGDCAPYQHLLSISHNQGVSGTHKHKTDYNWVGVNFLTGGVWSENGGAEPNTSNTDCEVEVSEGGLLLRGWQQLPWLKTGEVITRDRYSMYTHTCTIHTLTTFQYLSDTHPRRNAARHYSKCVAQM